MEPFLALFIKKDGNIKKIFQIYQEYQKKSIISNFIINYFFSLAGVPPLGGFFAKFYIFVAVIEQQMYALAIIGLLTTVMSAFYYLKIIKTIYFDENVIRFENEKYNTRFQYFASCTILLHFFLSISFK